MREAAGCARRRHQPPALKQRLRQVGVGGVHHWLAENRVDRVAARALERARIRRVETQLRQQGRPRRVLLGIGDVDLRGAETNLVRDAQARGHSVLE